MQCQNELYIIAQNGLVEIEKAIVELLRIRSNGLTNTEIANILGLSSNHEGGQKDYLSYSILGNLMSRNIVIKDRSGTRPVYILATNVK